MLSLIRVLQTTMNRDVFLFSGTIGSNLDPFDKHDNHECWDVLQRCRQVSGPDRPGPIWSLETPISQTGSFSTGERQLVSFARAMFRGSWVIIISHFDFYSSRRSICISAQLMATRWSICNRPAASALL